MTETIIVLSDLEIKRKTIIFGNLYHASGYNVLPLFPCGPKIYSFNQIALIAANIYKFYRLWSQHLRLIWTSTLYVVTQARMPKPLSIQAGTTSHLCWCNTEQKLPRLPSKLDSMIKLYTSRPLNPFWFFRNVFILIRIYLKWNEIYVTILERRCRNASFHLRKKGGV